MNGASGIFAAFGGRKASTLLGVEATLLTFVGTGQLDNLNLTIALCGAIALPIVYWGFT